MLDLWIRADGLIDVLRDRSDQIVGLTGSRAIPFVASIHRNSMELPVVITKGRSSEVRSAFDIILISLNIYEANLAKREIEHHRSSFPVCWRLQLILLINSIQDGSATILVQLYNVIVNLMHSARIIHIAIV